MTRSSLTRRRDAVGKPCGAGRRRGVTLVELLVALAVMGILASLLLPAVQAGRESARRVACQNNLRQLGLGLHVFHDRHRAFPAAGWTKAGPGNPAGRYVGWRALILPYLEQDQLGSRYDFGLHWWEGVNLRTAAVSVPTFLCPSTISRPPITVATPKPPRAAMTFPLPVAAADYEALMGVQPCVNPGRYGGPATNRGIMFRNSAVNLGHVLDGSSNTLLLVECAARPLVYRERRLRADLTNDQGWCWADSESGFSLDGSSQDGSRQCLGLVLTPRALNATNENEPYAFHPKGCLVLFGDGHVWLLDESIHLSVFAALATRAGGELAAIGE